MTKIKTARETMLALADAIINLSGSIGMHGTLGRAERKALRHLHDAAQNYFDVASKRPRPDDRKQRKRA